jgi:hypothetical protein
VARQPDEADHSLTEAVYRMAFKDDDAFKEERQGVIEERLGMRAFDEQDKQTLAESLGPLGFGRSMTDQLVRERSLPEMALFAGYALHFFGEDLERAGGVPAELRGTPGLGDSFNRALACTVRDIAAIGRAVAAVTGIEPPGEERRR